MNGPVQFGGGGKGVPSATQPEHEQAATDGAQALHTKAATPKGLYWFWEKLRSLPLSLQNSLTLSANTGDGNRLAYFTPSGEFAPGINIDAIAQAYSVGAILYVSVGGNNANGLRGRLDRPYRTIQAAHNAATAGDVIKLLPGDHYSSDVVITKSLTVDITGGTYVGEIRNDSTTATVTVLGDIATVLRGVVGYGVFKVQGVGEIRNAYHMNQSGNNWEFIRCRFSNCAFNFQGDHTCFFDTCSFVRTDANTLFNGFATGIVDMNNCTVVTNGDCIDRMTLSAWNSRFYSQNGKGILVGTDSVVKNCRINSFKEGIGFVSGTFVDNQIQVEDTTIFVRDAATANAFFESGTSSNGSGYRAKIALKDNLSNKATGLNPANVVLDVNNNFSKTIFRA